MRGSLPAVLLTAAGGFQGLGLARLLSESDGFRIVAADTNPEAPTGSLVDVFVQVPPVSEPERLLRALEEVCRAEDVRLILPATDHDLSLLAGAASRLARLGARVAVCPGELLGELRDKERLYRLLGAAGLPVLASVDPLTHAVPVIGKPRGGWGSRGLVIARRREEILGLSEAERSDRVWQRYLPEVRELSADFAIGFDGSVSPIGLRRRLQVAGGFAVISETVQVPEAEAVVARLAALVAGRGGCGLFNAQLLESGEGFVLSDVNPRLGTSAVHWRDSGFNPPLWLCGRAGLLPEARTESTPPSRKTVRLLEERVSASGERLPIAGIVFDLDDTLVPVKRFQLARLELALPVIMPGTDLPRARREACRLIEEGPRDRLIDALAATLGLPETGRLRLLDAYRSSWPSKCPSYPDVKPALDVLRRAGVKTAVLTDNPPETQRRKLEATGLLPLLDGVVYSREAGGEKPHPAGFARAAELLGLPPRRLAMAGDNPHRDLAGAAEAGFARLFWLRRAEACCGFAGALAERLPAFESYEPVADLRELLAHLRG
jgi:FMN phosphatase YigB (HAD superfamily)